MHATVVITNKPKTAGNRFDHSHLVYFKSKITIKSEAHRTCVTLLTLYARNTKKVQSVVDSLD